MTKTTANNKKRETKEDFIDNPQRGRKQRHGGAYPAGASYIAKAGRRLVIRPKRIYFPEHFCYCFSSNLCVLNTTNTD
jgi:hypothetical protein